MKCNVCGKDLAYIENVGYMIHSHCEYKAYAEYLNLKLTIEVLQSENEQLRAVLENAKETLEMLHPTMPPMFNQDIVYIRRSPPPPIITQTVESAKEGDCARDNDVTTDKRNCWKKIRI